MALTDRLTTAKSELESYLDSVRGAKLEQHQIDRLLTLNGLLGIGASGVTSSVVFASPQAVTQSGTWNVGVTGSLSLPTNASTSALQTTGNLNLSSIDSKLPVSLGSKQSANSLSFAPASDAIFTVSQTAITPAFLFTSTITRPANTAAYPINTVYGSVFELVSATVPTSGQWIIITDIEIIFNITALPTGIAGFQLYTYGVTPPSAVGNTGTFSLPSGDRNAIIFPKGVSLGNAELARGGGSVVMQANNLNLICKLTGTSLFSYLVTLAAFTPAAASETATIRVRAIAL